ncbi:MAG: Holliday junction resolvase RuvX [Rhodothermaceae bacterium]|nr:Holliday junction resolvase RuvX [Rhodothermaceae bacterium]
MSEPITEGRIIGIDYGKRRVGIAISDPLKLFSIPVGTFAPRDALKEVSKIRGNEGIEAVVIGWPLTIEGEEGVATERVQRFINQLKKAHPGVPLHKVDERYSSRRAMSALVEANVKMKARRQKGRIDSAAAAIILQDYLDESA